MNGAATTLLGMVWHGGSWPHIFALSAWATLTCAFVIVSRRWSGTERGHAPRRLLGWSALAASAISCGFYLIPSRFDWGVSLPLQMCDLAGLIAPIALLSGRRWARTLLHFWGFALCTQFFVTPVHEPGSAAYIVGWLLHGSIAASAVFDWAAQGYRPAAPDLAFALACGLLYAAVAFTVDLATGFNYGYLGRPTPGSTTIVDALGAWPGRAVWIVLIAAAAMGLVYGVGLMLRRITDRARPERPPVP